MNSSEKRDDAQRASLRDIAKATLEAISLGSYVHKGATYDLSAAVLSSKQRTRYYAPDSLLSTWSTTTAKSVNASSQISVLEISTLEGARLLAESQPNPLASATPKKIAILNFASAKRPGGGFINGARAQEESIARSSTLYPTLMTSTAQQFYTLHNRDGRGGYYTHAMVYSPGVVLFRDDDGALTAPLDVDVLTSPAVNAGVVRTSFFGKFGGVEQKIEQVMKERMGRILRLLEKEGATDLVLGSFGTGVFRNNVDTVARLWAELLVVDGARFKNSFERIVFAIIGRQTFTEFRDTFNSY